MQLVLSFSTLLASLLVAITLVQVDAAPFNPTAGLKTLPLKRVHQARDDIHPQIVRMLWPLYEFLIFKDHFSFSSSTLTAVTIVWQG